MVCLFVPRQLMFVFIQVVRVSGGYLILCFSNYLIDVVVFFLSAF